MGTLGSHVSQDLKQALCRPRPLPAHHHTVFPGSVSPFGRVKAAKKKPYLPQRQPVEL